MHLLIDSSSHSQLDLQNLSSKGCHLYGVLHSFPIKNIFYDKMDFLFSYDETGLTAICVYFTRYTIVYRKTEWSGSLLFSPFV